MTSAAAASVCGCDPPWPGLVAHTEAGDVAVEPAATPGALACLYQAHCTHCGTTYPGPFRVPPVTRHPGHPNPRTDMPVTVPLSELVGCSNRGDYARAKFGLTATMLWLPRQVRTGPKRHRIQYAADLEQLEIVQAQVNMLLGLTD